MEDFWAVSILQNDSRNADGIKPGYLDRFYIQL
jgi:hypothetical protein